MTESALASTGVLDPTSAAISFRETGWSLRGLLIGLGALALVIGASVVGNVFGLLHPNELHYEDTLQGPSLNNLFGTDALGRDVFQRTLAATLLDLRVGLITIAVPMICGVLLGARVGFVGGIEESIVMRLMDVILALPFLVLVLAIVATSGPGLTGVYIGLIVAAFPVFVRITRGEMLVLREQQFLLAAETLGFSRRRIVFRHALPHLLRPNLVFALAAVVGNITALAALSYLGVGARPPTPEWGAIIAEGQPYLLSAWWISTLPGLFMVCVCMAIYIVGEALADRLNVHMSGVV
jgi:peptide/nickel transport system permease protein